MMEFSQFAVVVLKNVREFVQPAIDALTKRMDDGLALVRAEFEQRIAAIPAGKDGAPGRDGADGGPGGQGEPGKDGAAGRDGKDADPAAVAEIVLPAIKALAAETLAAVPAPKDGKDGQDGKGVTVEEFRQLFESEQAKWALEFERRAGDVLQRAIDRIPAPKDGIDGLGFDDLESFETEKCFGIRFQRGDQVKELTFAKPSLGDAYQGTWKDAEFARGDVVTWGGSLWIALRDTNAKPGAGTDDVTGWKLACKRGNDGRDGVNGKDATRQVKLA